MNENLNESHAHFFSFSFFFFLFISNSLEKYFKTHFHRARFPGTRWSVKNVGKDNNEKSKKAKIRKDGRAKTVGGRQIRDETSGKDKKCWPKERKKEKKNYSDLHQILFSLVSWGEGKDSGLPLQCFLPLLLLYPSSSSPRIYRRKEEKFRES